MERRKTYREKRLADPALALNNKIEALFYEGAARTIVKSGMAGRSELPSEEEIEKLRIFLNSIKGDIMAGLRPMVGAVAQEANALDMHPQDLSETIEKIFRRNLENPNRRRLRDAITRIEQEEPENHQDQEQIVTCPLCLDPDDDALPAVREVFDAMKCSNPDCDHHGNHARLYLSQECHPAAGFHAQYCKVHCTVTLVCAVCGGGAACILVASEAEEDSGNATIH